MEGSLDSIMEVEVGYDYTWSADWAIGAKIRNGNVYPISHFEQTSANDFVPADAAQLLDSLNDLDVAPACPTKMPFSFSFPIDFGIEFYLAMYPHLTFTPSIESEINILYAGCSADDCSGLPTGVRVDSYLDLTAGIGLSAGTVGGTVECLFDMPELVVGVDIWDGEVPLPAIYDCDASGATVGNPLWSENDALRIANKQCKFSTNWNPIWNVGTLTLDECLDRCDSETDNQGRECVAIEWKDGGNAQPTSATKQCKLAWGCDSFVRWNWGSVFLRREPEVVDRGNPHNAATACSGNSCLGECEGDCDNDTHCKAGLKCWHRSGWNSNIPPGCRGQAHAKSHDYCYDPTKRIEVEYTGNPPPKCQCLTECQGDCDHDDDCVGDLKCQDRGGWNVPVPSGCKGTAKGRLTDYCYDPDNNAQNAFLE